MKCAKHSMVGFSIFHFKMPRTHSVIVLSNSICANNVCVEHMQKTLNNLRGSSFHFHFHSSDEWEGFVSGLSDTRWKLLQKRNFWFLMIWISVGVLWVVRFHENWNNLIKRLESQLRLLGAEAENWINRFAKVGRNEYLVFQWSNKWTFRTNKYQFYEFFFVLTFIFALQLLLTRNDSLQPAARIDINFALNFVDLIVRRLHTHSHSRTPTRSRMSNSIPFLVPSLTVRLPAFVFNTSIVTWSDTLQRNEHNCVWDERTRLRLSSFRVQSEMKSTIEESNGWKCGRTPSVGDWHWSSLWQRASLFDSIFSIFLFWWYCVAIPLRWLTN